jgi:hypothetical protein
MDPEETVETLQQETEKWRDTLEERLEGVEPVDDTGEELLTNAEAYLQDADHFKEDADLVRAFEAVVWGWSHLSLGVKHGFLRETGE